MLLLVLVVAGSLSKPYFAANSAEVRPLCSIAALQTELAL